MLKYYIFLAVALVLNAVANILMKAGMLNAPAELTPKAQLTHYVTSWPVIVGVCLFGLNVIAYTQALSRIPLSVAYPLMTSLGFLIVVAGSAYFFKEHISAIQIAGFALIITGVILVTR